MATNDNTTTLTNNYSADCDTGSALAREFLRNLAARVNAPGYDGMERHWLGDFLLSSSSEGLQVGFCYELIRQIEPVLVRH